MKRHHPFFRLKTLATVASLFFAANTAWAVTPFVIKDIKVEGLQRVDAAPFLPPSPSRWATPMMTSTAQPPFALYLR